jgi:hypothetical protein
MRYISCFNKVQHLQRIMQHRSTAEVLVIYVLYNIDTYPISICCDFAAWNVCCIEQLHVVYCRYHASEYILCLNGLSGFIMEHRLPACIVVMYATNCSRIVCRTDAGSSQVTFWVLRELHQFKCQRKSCCSLTRIPFSYMTALVPNSIIINRLTISVIVKTITSVPLHNSPWLYLHCCCFACKFYNEY